jgi:hypothetical protein
MKATKRRTPPTPVKKSTKKKTKTAITAPGGEVN